MPTELQTLLKFYLADNPGSESKLADKFEVAISTVKRWKKGTARPHQQIAGQIIKYIKNQYRE